MKIKTANLSNRLPISMGEGPGQDLQFPRNPGKNLEA